MGKQPRYALDDESRMQLNMKCLDTLVPKAKAGDVVVPPFSGEEKSEALDWLTLFSQWALQQGMSPDLTLEIASTYTEAALHLESPSSTWAEFVRLFFDHFKGDGESLFMQWYSKRAANARLTWFSYRELRRATNGFSAAKAVANGRVGVVYDGILGDGRRVAVKRFKDPSHSLEDVLYEVHLHRSLPRSSHFVGVVGYSSDGEDPLLVYEYVDNGNLDQHLQRHYENGLTWNDRLAVAVDVADAISLLHYNSKFPIYHRDIKSTNILLDHKRRAKLADFGIAAAVSHEKQRSFCQAKVKGSRGYTDPHYESTGQLTDTADVYSFGVVLMEIVTGLKVGLDNRTKTFLPDLVVEMSSLGLVDDIVDSNIWCADKGGEIPCQHCLKPVVEEVIELAIHCCSPDPTDRPKINEVADTLREIQLKHRMKMEADRLTHGKSKIHGKKTEADKLDQRSAGKERCSRDHGERSNTRATTSALSEPTFVRRAPARYPSPLLKLVRTLFKFVVSRLRPYVLCRKGTDTCVQTASRE